MEFTLGFGGSGRGISHYKTLNRCRNRATLNWEASQNQLPGAEDSENTAAGTLAHGFMALYHGNGHLEASEVLFEPEHHPSLAFPGARSEAERAFNAYQERFAPTSLGKVIGVEYRVGPLEVHDTDPAITVDLLTKISKADLPRIGMARGLDLSPGHYIVDHKFLGQKSGTMIDSYLNDMQGIGYQVIWERRRKQLKLPEVNGMIINFIIKTKAIQFMSLLIPPPTEVQIEAFDRWLAHTREDEMEDPNRINPTACFWPSICKWWVEGKCDWSSK